jgi:hypothetical protein
VSGHAAWLRRRADRLEDLAAALEGRPIPRAGTIVAGSVAELIARVSANPLVLAPPVSAVLAWAAASTAAWARVMRPLCAAGAPRPCVFELVWHDGVIDPIHSRVGAALPVGPSRGAAPAPRRPQPGIPAAVAVPAASTRAERAGNDRALLALVDQLAGHENEDSAQLLRMLAQWHG